MHMRLSTWTLVLTAMLAWPAAGYAQEAIVTGIVTDATGGVLPGVTVTATHTATGNTFFSVTDDRGVYRIPARIGTYQLTAELTGFATATRGGVTLLVGQEAAVNLQLSPAGLQESVTVTAEAPLISTTQSQIGSNIDARQMEELPVQGRQGIPVGPRVRLDAQLEIFNVFNRFNANGIEANELNIRFRQLTESNNIAYRPRVLQLGFRLAF